MSDSLQTKSQIDEKSEDTNGKEENLSKQLENETNIQKKGEKKYVVSRFKQKHKCCYQFKNV
jgi:hypothetical protein